MQGRRVATKFKKINWPATPATFGTPAFVNGKIKSKKRNKRVVVLQQKLPSGWQKVDKDKTNKHGRFHLKVKTNWYHKKLKMRVVVKQTRKAGGNTSKRRGFTVNPAYPLLGSPHAWNRIAPGYKIQFNPCSTIRWKGNIRLRTGRRLGRHPRRYGPAGRRDRHPLQVRRLDQRDPRLEAQVAQEHQPGRRLGRPFADQVEPARQLHRPWRAAEDQVVARTGKGKRAYQITRSGLVLDNTFPAPAGFHGPNARGSIIIHELGHVAGLGHPFQSVQTMYPSADELGQRRLPGR